MSRTHTTETTTSDNNNTSVSFPLKNLLHAITPAPSVVSFASYMTIGAFTLAAIGSLFCFFFVMSIFDDFIHLISPGRIITYTQHRWQSLDWTGLVDKLSEQLTNFAEWEKHKRASWYPYDDNTTSYNNGGDKFHELISAVTTYMNDYVNHRQMHMKQRQNKRKNH
jgi:hypothetical protein